MTPKELGVLGEKIAQDFLKRKGYLILDKNYSPHYLSGPKRGEIDIVAEKEGVITFIEIKTLTEKEGLFFPEDQVSSQKQKRILQTAQNYLLEKKYKMETKWQIDVLAIEINSHFKKAKIRHLKNILSA